MRDALGLDPFDNAAADRPMVLTATGFVPIEANAQGTVVGSRDANGLNANGQSQSAKLALLKARSDDPEHPGWPAGTPGGQGGKFRPKDGEGSQTPYNSPLVAAESSRSETRYAALETEGRPDTSNVPKGEQYAGPPRDIAYGPNAWTGIQQIDETTKRLAEILARVVDETTPTHLSPSFYGILVHKRFAAAVIDERIRGISPSDVEHTFSLPSDYGGHRKAVKPDVVLRNDSGDIIAIYDVKTLDASLRPGRANQLRAATKADSNVPVIDLHIERGPVIKSQQGDPD
jgi:hypothetical protein